MRKFLSGVAVAALLLSGCAAPGNETAASNGTAPATTSNDADPALWLVKDGDTDIYLFGTFHFLRPGQTWFDEAVRAAYDKSTEVVIEQVQPDEAVAGPIVARLAVDPDGPPLRQKLSAATRPKYEAAMRTLGLPVEPFDRFEPWFAGMLMGQTAIQKQGLTLDAGVESVLTTTSKSAGKSLSGLETFEQLLGYLDTLPEAEQIRFLEGTVDGLDEVSMQKLEQMSRYWASGDAERLGAMMNEELRSSPVVAKALLTDRNARWAQWIDDRMDKPGTVFVAVGAGHLAGADSVQQMLAKRNLRATRVRY